MNLAQIERVTRNETDPGTRALHEAIIAMMRTKGSGTAMCHEQGKTSVYLSADQRWIVEHPPHGPITRTAFRRTAGDVAAQAPLEDPR